eukprot:1182812-Prorocentrum_minimum.AAC.2
MEHCAMHCMLRDAVWSVHLVCSYSTLATCVSRDFSDQGGVWIPLTLTNFRRRLDLLRGLCHSLSVISNLRLGLDVSTLPW